ncbi:MAG: hypothetical protein OXR62_14600 [Ahrensia sp.]|nr:hypothetical protein [Ahrensia sp.]
MTRNDTSFLTPTRTGRTVLLILLAVQTVLIAFILWRLDGSMQRQPAQQRDIPCLERFELLPDTPHRDGNCLLNPTRISRSA